MYVGETCCSRTAATVRESTTAELAALRAEVERLREALEGCDMSMATAAIHGVRNVLPPAYQDSWAAAHQAARAALEGEQ